MYLLGVLAAVCLVCTAAAQERTAPQHRSAAATRKIVAELLKIPLADPKVSATVHDTREEDGLTLEDISWKSLDSENPPAFLIRPTKRSKGLPAIIFLHGSSGSRESECTRTFGEGKWTNANGKTTTRLLGAARELARRGYVTLAMTQRGLDNRRPSTDDQEKDLLIHGRNLMGVEVYEIRQAITYLQQRPEVDPRKIGISGLSFGGITSFYTWLVDSRIAAAAPICGSVGSVEVFSKHGPRTYHGFYWWIPDLLTKGDHADFAAAMAPRPLMLWAPLSDIAMPKEGVDRFIAQVRPAYEDAGAGNAFVVYQRPGVHDLTLEAFELMSQFFDAHLKGRGR